MIKGMRRREWRDQHFNEPLYEGCFTLCYTPSFCLKASIIFEWYLLIHKLKLGESLFWEGCNQGFLKLFPNWNGESTEIPIYWKLCWNMNWEQGFRSFKHKINYCTATFFIFWLLTFANTYRQTKAIFLKKRHSFGQTLKALYLSTWPPNDPTDMSLSCWKCISVISIKSETALAV